MRSVAPPTRKSFMSINRKVSADELAEQPALALCWAASTRATSGYANLGDSLSAVTIAALAGRSIWHADFDADQTKLVAVGSIGHEIVNGTAVVWGTGAYVRGSSFTENALRTAYDVRAMRGLISAQHYRDAGIEVPEVYGDPVWFLPSIINEPVRKRYELGVIPHIGDVSGHHPDAPVRGDSLCYQVNPADASSVLVINTWHEPTWRGLLDKLRLIRSCKRIASQSFHGVVIAEAYGIPVLNFGCHSGAQNGVIQVALSEPCVTDPRVWEFFAGGRRPFFWAYSQQRNQCTDWGAVIRAVDNYWIPFEYDAGALLAAFPLPLAYDPSQEPAPSHRLVETLEF